MPVQRATATGNTCASLVSCDLPFQIVLQLSSSASSASPLRYEAE
jgi:hypothetical protein